MKRILTALLTAALMLPLASCTSDGSTGETAVTSGTTAEASETAAKETNESELRANHPDTLPKLDFSGAAVNFLSRGGNDFVMLEMGPEEEVGDIVADALYERNRSVEERLNVDIVITYGTDHSSNYSSSYKNTILSGDHVHDVIGVVHAAGITNSHEKIFVNLADVPYIDYSQPWWNMEYMEEISVSSDVRYFFQGDISLLSLRNLSAMFYNKTMYGSIYDDPDELYTYTLDGTWTHEKFRELVQASYQDINGNGYIDIGDVIGSSGDAVTRADHYSYTAGMKMSERDEEGYPKLIEDQSRNIAVMEALNTLYYHTNGFMLITDSSIEGMSQGGWMIKKFKADEMMFLGDRLLIADYLRDMESSYGIIPMPKLNEEQDDYKALVHNSASLYVLPITIDDERLEKACAVVEAMCAQSYRTVIPAYFDVALKVKYSRDEMSGQVIDMLREAMMTDFCYANSSALNSVGTLARVLLAKGADASYMSHYDSILQSVQIKLDDMIEKAGTM